jgi:hypothetical protein
LEQFQRNLLITYHIKLLCYTRTSPSEWINPINPTTINGPVSTREIPKAINAKNDFNYKEIQIFSNKHINSIEIFLI